MDQQRIDEIRERFEEATYGPWQRGNKTDKGDIEVVGYEETSLRKFSLIVGEIFYPYDADFIIHSRQDIPDLLDEIDRLRGILRQFVDGIECEDAPITEPHFTTEDEVWTVPMRGKFGNADEPVSNTESVQRSVKWNSQSERFPK